MRVGRNMKKDGFLKLHLNKGLFRVAYKNEKCFDSSGCSSAKLIFKFIQRRKVKGVSFESKILII